MGLQLEPQRRQQPLLGQLACPHNLGKRLRTGGTHQLLRSLGGGLNAAFGRSHLADDQDQFVDLCGGQPIAKGGHKSATTRRNDHGDLLISPGALEICARETDRPRRYGR